MVHTKKWQVWLVHDREQITDMPLNIRFSVAGSIAAL